MIYTSRELPKWARGDNPWIASKVQSLNPKMTCKVFFAEQGLLERRNRPSGMILAKLTTVGQLWDLSIPLFKEALLRPGDWDLAFMAKLSLFTPTFTGLGPRESGGLAILDLTRPDKMKRHAPDQTSTLLRVSHLLGFPVAEEWSELWSTVDIAMTDEGRVLVAPKGLLDNQSYPRLLRRRNKK